MKTIRARPTAIRSCAQSIAFLLITVPLCLAGATMNAQPVHSSTAVASVLYEFTGGVDGGTPYAGVVVDTAGNLYGTTTTGGTYGQGTVYMLSPSSSGWTETVLHSFSGGQDGATPYGGVLLESDGSLWGTTYAGGDPACGCGTVWQLTPSLGSWTFNLIHAFLGGSDGARPAGGLVEGRNGIFGTTSEGGNYSLVCTGHGCGTIFWITPTYFNYDTFVPQVGVWPRGTMTYDDYCECYYGTTEYGPGPGWGTVFAEYDRAIYKVYAFSLSGAAGVMPLAGVIHHGDGIYGTTSSGTHGGSVFKILDAGGIRVLHQFTASNGDGGTPVGALVFDEYGNLYGTTKVGGQYSKGVVFRLTPGLNQKWSETILHDFTGSDGAYPYLTSLVFDSADNLYGATSSGGTYGAGVVYEIKNVREGPKATLSRTSLGFGSQAINTTSAARAVTLSNLGDTPINFTGISINGQFAIASNTCGTQLAIGTQCQVGVVFAPTALGTMTGTLTFTDDAPNSPQTVALIGKGVLPATLTPAGGRYAVQPVGTTSTPKTFTLTNNLLVALNNIVISTTGDFSKSATTCGASLAAKTKCTIDVVFTPTATGLRTGTLTVSDSAENSPQASLLTGTGN